ncbi:MAG TPA: GAF domain-containing protein [Gemmatimonadales bacterium]|nr:GAF domain-containing protein [Gemmatimonadales bacterium]
MTDDIQTLKARIEALEAERRQLLTVVEILEEVGGAAQFTDVVQAVARRLGEALGLDRCSIFLAEKGGRSARLVASFEDPSIRNYMVDLDRYPELRRALETGQTVVIADAESDPGLQGVQKALKDRKVKSITVVPIKWRGAAIGAIFLRTFRDGQNFTDGDIRFVEVVASLTAKALRNAHRIERLQQRIGGEAAPIDPQQAVLAEFLRRLLTQAAARGGHVSMAQATQEELDRLVGVTLTVLAQEADLH